MRHFLKMVDLANRYGVVAKGSREFKARFLPMDKGTIDAFARCETIVFTPKNKEPKNIDEDDMDTPDFGLATVELAAPFEIFSYEMLDGPICSPRPEDEVQANVWCIIAEERGPNLWGFYALVEDIESGSSYVVKTNSFSEITREFVNRLNSERVGSEAVRTSIKIGTGKNKRRHRIRRIIHVCQKSVAKKLESAGTRIDFSHRFLVRGHWRRLPENKLGKNRNGDYCVRGATWVSEFEKGPDNLPLIKKTRLVE